MRVSRETGLLAERLTALPRDIALGELARRYLAGHGPADDRDLARWAGITLGDARRGLRTIGTRLDDRADGLAALADHVEAARLPASRLLGSFEPSLCGWVSREAITGTQQGIVTTNGIFRPFAMVRGAAVATWGLAGGRVDLTPFASIPSATKQALDRDAHDVLSYLGLPA